MAKQRENIPSATKDALRQEAGNKCANPGCSTVRTHIHHIHEWAVYETNDEQHLIAVCPTCHDEIHHGNLLINDDNLYRWKSIKRKSTLRSGHIYVEPGEVQMPMFGSVGLIGLTHGFVALDVSPTNQISFRIVDNDILLISLNFNDLSSR